MMKKHKIEKEEIAEIEAALKQNKDKRIDKRLTILLLRAEGKKDREIAQICGYDRQSVSRVICRYNKNGLEFIVNPKYGGNHRNLSIEQEKELLSGFAEQAKDGHIITTSEIKAEYERQAGHKSGGSTIYFLLKRHGWRKVMPRSKHPGKASDEAIEASKKLTIGWTK